MPTPRQRINSDPASVEEGLVSLVLTWWSYFGNSWSARHSASRQGDLSDEQIERIGTTLMLLEEKMVELREHST